MDFEDAAVRLARDQSKLRNRKRNIVISEKAKKQAEYQKRIQARLREEREQKKRNETYQKKYYLDCKRSLKEKSLAANIEDLNATLLLKPTSIFGDGDKITLPQSVLQTLTSSDDPMSIQGGNPWTFRIGILNPKYEFPLSPLIQALEVPTDDDDREDGDYNIDDKDQEQQLKPFLQELDHRYLTYTHCTVVEFTQDEGHVGIPALIAQTLLNPKNRRNEEVSSGLIIPSTTTVDPDSSLITSKKDVVPMNHITEKEEGKKIASLDPENDGMQINDIVNEEEEKTPGHLAWGAFEIPIMKLEISIIQLPKGIGCTLVPTEEAVRNYFHRLKDVKLVLEQSLIRTRATLSIGDIVRTWHRGIKFDLIVDAVLPSNYQAVTCINTDIEVQIREVNTDIAPDESNHIENTSSKVDNEDKGYRLGTGVLIKPPPLQVHCGIAGSLRVSNELPTSLLPEPDMNQKVGVCTIQIRYSGGNGRRRFALDTTTVKDLFTYASFLVNQDELSFRLVTRFPRRELSLLETNISDKYLNQAGFQNGQEMLMVEDL